MNLSDVEMKIIEYLEKNPQSSIEDIGTALFYGRTTITRYMKLLKDKGIISRAGSKHSGYYKIDKNKLKM